MFLGYYLSNSNFFANFFMTNSTPSLLVWIAEYQKYRSLVDQGDASEADALKTEIVEGLAWVDLSWEDLEVAFSLKATQNPEDSV